MGVVEFESFGVHEFKSSAAVVPSRMSVTQLWRGGRVQPPSSPMRHFRLRSGFGGQDGVPGPPWEKKRMSNVHQGTQNVQGRSPQCFRGSQPSAIIGVPDEMLEYSAESWSLDISLMDIGHSVLYFSEPGPPWGKKRMSNVHQGTQNVQGRSPQCFRGSQPSAIIGVPDEMLEYSAETWSLDISLPALSARTHGAIPKCRRDGHWTFGSVFQRSSRYWEKRECPRPASPSQKRYARIPVP